MKVSAKTPMSLNQRFKGPRSRTVVKELKICLQDLMMGLGFVRVQGLGLIRVSANFLHNPGKGPSEFPYEPRDTHGPPVTEEAMLPEYGSKVVDIVSSL